ncbi:MAG TPA: hypothetical protein DCX80_01390 [Chloroflexi bacterium]|nr:hypothetical protein [Chloroflexota bacterium]
MYGRYLSPEADPNESQEITMSVRDHGHRWIADAQDALVEGSPADCEVAAPDRVRTIERKG